LLCLDEDCYSRVQDEDCRSRDGNLTFWNNTCTPVDVVCRSSVNRCLRDDDGDKFNNCTSTWHGAWNSTHCLNVSALAGTNFDDGASWVDGYVGNTNNSYLYVPLTLVYEHSSASEEFFT
jgi:hypothetical protein